MPIYEFRCEICGTKFEELVKVGTESIPCPVCGNKKTNRLISCCAFSVGGKTVTTSSSTSCTSCSGGSCVSCGVGK